MLESLLRFLASGNMLEIFFLHSCRNTLKTPVAVYFFAERHREQQSNGQTDSRIVEQV